MYTLLLTTALLTQPGTEYFPPPPPSEERPKLVFYIDPTEPIEARLKTELTVDWSKRIPKEILLTYSLEEYVRYKEAIEKLNRRTKSVHAYFDISFVDRRATYDMFQLAFGQYGLKQQLPHDSHFEYATNCLKFVEYIRDDYYHDKAMDIWYEKGYEYVTDDFFLWRKMIVKPQPKKPTCFIDFKLGE